MVYAYQTFNYVPNIYLINKSAMTLLVWNGNFYEIDLGVSEFWSIVKGDEKRKHLFKEWDSPDWVLIQIDHHSFWSSYCTTLPKAFCYMELKGDPIIFGLFEFLFSRINIFGWVITNTR